MNMMTRNRKTIDSGLTFLTKELEKTDSKILEPLSSTTYARDMPIRSGGGIVENIRQLAVNYATSGSNVGEQSIIGGQSNDIPVMQADLSEESWKTYIFAEVLKVGFFDDMKMQAVSRSLQEMLDKGIHLHYDKYLDQNVYIGMTGHGGTGLVNNPNIARYTVDPHTASGTDTQWEGKTADEILEDINNAQLYTWKASGYDLSGMANHFLVPPSCYALLVHRKVGTTGDKSILTYLEENNLGRNQGRDFYIGPCTWCEKRGTGNTSRMVAYANAEDRIRMDVTLPLKRWITDPVVQQMAYLTPYYAQFSEVQFLYSSPVVYADGI